MTRYTVVWHEGAQEDLADVWINARDRNGVAAAAHLIDVDLSQDAETKGVDVAEGLRAFFAPPLRILFTVNEGDRITEVVCVRRL